jgi:hypothetical protein
MEGGSAGGPVVIDLTDVQASEQGLQLETAQILHKTSLSLVLLAAQGAVPEPALEECLCRSGRP